MSAPATGLRPLEDIVGSSHLLRDAASLANYEVDGLRPSAVAQPGSADETTEVVRFAAAEKLALIATGSRTKLGMGMPPRRYDLALDMTRLNRVLAYDPGDLTLGVEPGVRLTDLARTLAEHKQFIPLAVPYLQQATIGGTLASGVDSPLRQFYGAARDYLLGLEFVTGEGVLAKGGGRVVKNVTGYDLHKLLIGSLGTLGVITRVNFRTFPLPPISRGLLATFPTFAGAVELRKRIAQSPLTLLTLEILSPEVVQIFARATPSTEPALAAAGALLSTSHWTLAAGFGGTERVVARFAADLTRMAEETKAAGARILGDDERPAVWGRLREFIPLMLESSPAATIVKISALPGQAIELLDRVQRIAEQCELPCATLARGVGVIYAVLLPATNEEGTLARLARAANELIQAMGEAGARAMIPWCPRELKRTVNIWGPTHGDFALTERVKKTFDPLGILSPGRFPGGL